MPFHIAIAQDGSPVIFGHRCNDQHRCYDQGKGKIDYTIDQTCKIEDLCRLSEPQPGVVFGPYYVMGILWSIEQQERRRGAVVEHAIRVFPAEGYPEGLVVKYPGGPCVSFVVLRRQYLARSLERPKFAASAWSVFYEQAASVASVPLFAEEPEVETVPPNPKGVLGTLAELIVGCFTGEERSKPDARDLQDLG